MGRSIIIPVEQLPEFLAVQRPAQNCIRVQLKSFHIRRAGECDRSKEPRAMEIRLKRIRDVHHLRARSATHGQIRVELDDLGPEP